MMPIGEKKGYVQLYKHNCFFRIEKMIETARMTPRLPLIYSRSSCVPGTMQGDKKKIEQVPGPFLAPQVPQTGVGRGRETDD